MLNHESATRIDAEKNETAVINLWLVGGLIIAVLGYAVLSGMLILTLDVHFISSLPVILRSACKAWVDRGPVQIVAAED